MRTSTSDMVVSERRTSARAQRMSRHIVVSGIPAEEMATVVPQAQFAIENVPSGSGGA